jgi:hypothetical protein
MAFETFRELQDYSKNIAFNLELLEKRIICIEKYGTNSTEFLALYESILTQLRSMFIENERYKTNYTIQVMFDKIGKPEITNQIQEFFERKLLPFDKGDFIEGELQLTLREAIKVSVDKFIVHYDKTDQALRTIESVCRMRLLTKTDEFYVKKIVEQLLSIIGDAMEAIDYKDIVITQTLQKNNDN